MPVERCKKAPMGKTNGPQKWAIRISTYTYTGKLDANGNPEKERTQPRHYFDSKKACEAFWAHHLLKKQGGMPQSSTLRLHDFLLHHYLPYYRERRRESSYLQRERHVRVHIIPALGRYQLDQLKASHVQAFYSALGTRCAANTVRNISSTLTHALERAVRWEMLTRNPCKGAEKPVKPKKPPEIWTPEQARSFLAAEDDPSWRCLWTMLALTGMRKGELLALTWDDVDLDAGVLHITRTLTSVKGNGGFALGPAKTGAGQRMVALPSQLIQGLRALRAPDHADKWRVHRKHRTFPRTRRGGHTQQSNKGELLISRTIQSEERLQQRIFPLTPAALDYRWRRNIRRANLPYVKIHGLRHGNATVGLEAGIPLKVMSERLGHANISITADVYSHVTRALDRDAADAIGNALLGGLVEGAPEV